MLTALRWLCAALAIAGSASLCAASRPFDAAAATAVVSIAKPQIAPDGRLIAVIVSRADVAGNRFTAELRVIDAATGREAAALPPDWEVAESRWSPDGRTLAVLARAPDGGDQAQLFAMTRGEWRPRVLTSSSERITSFAWSPDSQRLAFAKEEELDLPRVDGRLVSFPVEDGAGYLALEPRRLVHLWLTDLRGTPARRLTGADWTLQVPFNGNYPLVAPIAWAPDGRSIVIATQRRPNPDSMDRALRVVDLATGQVRSLLPDDARTMNPVVSPDGRTVAYWEYPGGPAFAFAIRRVRLGDGTILPDPPRPIDRNLTLAQWMPNGRDLLVGGHDDDRTALWLQRPDAPPLRVATGDVDVATHFRTFADVARTGVIAFVGTTPTSPPEVYVTHGRARPRQLTHYNDEVRMAALANSTMLRWKTADGLTANGVVTYPPDRVKGKRAPLVLVLHGGPQSASMLGWNSFTQQLAARGWIVFEPNYRGSDNLGRRFTGAMHGDMGQGPGEDVMAGLRLLQQRGDVDDRRIAVTGESYGGYMALWLTGHYPGWRASVVAAGLVDTADSRDLADMGQTTSERFSGASPWSPGGREANWRQSPIASFAHIRTPTLILSTVLDHRVPVASSYRLFHALRENGVDTQFRAYPVAGHGTSDPAREADWNGRWIGWIQQHFETVDGAKRLADPATPGTQSVSDPGGATH